MEIKTKYGSVDFDEIENYDLSSETLNYLIAQKEVAEMFFSDEIDLTAETHITFTNQIKELAEVVIAGEKFSSPERAFALLELLNGISLADVEEANNNPNEFIVDNDSEFLVLTDDEADELAIENEANLLEDMGISDYVDEHTKEYIYDNFVDTDWFDDVLEESNRNYVEDIKEESADDDIYISRLHQEMVEYGIMDEPEWPDEDDFEDDEDGFENAKEEYQESLEQEVDNKIDEFVEHKKNDYDSPVEWFKDSFGKEELEKAIQSHNLVDFDKVAKYLVDQYGRGNSLARYDGEEHDVTVEYKDEKYEFYIYQTS